MLTRRARELRNNATPAERALWNELRQVEPRFTRQLPIGPYIADFACRRAKLVIEIDGRNHETRFEYDERRTRYLVAAGWRVLRFGNEETRLNPAGIAGYCAKVAVAGGTHP